MLYILQHEKQKLDRITKSKKAVLNSLITDCKLLGILEGDDKIINETLQKVSNGAVRGGWIKHTDAIDKFLANSKKDILITIAEYADTILVSLTDQKHFKHKILKSKEYRLSIEEFNSLMNAIAPFHIYGNIFTKTPEMDDILANLKQFENG